MAGYITPERSRAVPSSLAGDLTFAHVENARFGWDDGQGLSREIQRAFTRAGHQGRGSAPLNFLALSGGQEDGAFGAGLLAGWSQHGGRPSFNIVTGTSTGALAAPFAFLGSEFDGQLAEMYKTTGSDDVVTQRYVVAAITDDAMMDTTPLYRTIAQYLTSRVLQRLADEYRKGRLLLISTTNLDSGKLVIWNIGAIAASDNPKRLYLVRKIILASAAIPGLFPPVMIDVTLPDGPHQEMHVDGGTASQVFLFPPSLDMASVMKPFVGVARPAAYIIRNGHVAPDPEEVERRTLAIAGRAIETMISSNAVGELYRIYTTTRRDRIQFNLALVGEDFTEPYLQRFDRTYMTKLFEYGRAQGASGYAWLTSPPGFITSAGR